MTAAAVAALDLKITFIFLCFAEVQGETFLIWDAARALNVYFNCNC